MKYTDVVNGVAYTVEKAGKYTEITEICSNSKKVKHGDAFLAIVGIKQDGHKYISEAVNRGAKIIICNKDKASSLDLSEDVTLISVEDNRAVFSRIANNLHGDPSSKFKLVGVTGTNGKTSTTTMVDHVFRSLGYSTALIGTINIYI